MNLIIDIGNTKIKLAVFQESKLIFKDSVQKAQLVLAITKIQKRHTTLEQCIISSTAGLSLNSLKFLENSLSVLQLTHKTHVPYTNVYATPHTLGLDRIGLIAGAAQSYPNTDVLVIDAGTCITYDFLTKENHYLGGAISPGLAMRFKGMHDYTAKLPSLKVEEVPNYIGNSTVSCMQSGVMWGVIHEIDGFILQYKEKYPDLTVIFTGGDAEILAKRIKNSIFANSNFLLEGLNHILEFNKNT